MFGIISFMDPRNEVVLGLRTRTKGNAPMETIESSTTIGRWGLGARNDSIKSKSNNVNA